MADVSARSSTSEGPAHGRAATSWTPKHSSSMEIVLAVIGMVACFGGMMVVIGLTSRLRSRIWGSLVVPTEHSTQER